MNVVGLLIPGYNIRTDFSAIEPSKCVLTLSCPGDVTGPLAAVTEVGLFLLPNTPLPAGFGLLCYWQITAVGQPNPAATGFELLGSLTPQQPSQIFQTGWAEHEQLVEISSTNVPVQVTFAVSMEPLSNIQNLHASSLSPAVAQKRLFVAQKVAMNLFQFLQSFDTGTAGAGNMVVPNNIFDRWLQRFENKFRRDPNFFLRTDNE